MNHEPTVPRLLVSHECGLAIPAMMHHDCYNTFSGHMNTDVVMTALIPTL